MPNAAPVTFPLGAPVVTGNQISVDTALNMPNYITRRLADLTLQRFIVDRIFSSSGQAVTGGAVIYDQLLTNQLFTARDVERRMPSDEYPLVGSNRMAPMVASVEDYGGKFFVTDEARRRNSAVLFNNQIQQLANTIVRKVNTRAVATLQASVAALAGDGTFAGHNWTSVVTAGTNATSATGYPAADFAHAQLVADVKELGVTYDLWLLNPQEHATLATVYGPNLRLVLDSYGISTYATNRIPAGTAYAVATGQVGFLDYEQGLMTVTWPDPGRVMSWVQSSVKPVMGITNPYSVLAVTGLAG